MMEHKLNISIILKTIVSNFHWKRPTFHSRSHRFIKFLSLIPVTVIIEWHLNKLSTSITCHDYFSLLNYFKLQQQQHIVALFYGKSLACMLSEAFRLISLIHILNFTHTKWTSKIHYEVFDLNIVKADLNNFRLQKF